MTANAVDTFIGTNMWVSGLPLSAMLSDSGTRTVLATMFNNQFLTNDTLAVNEIAAPAGVAASDLLYGDSTAHRFKMNNNNSGADVVVGATTTDTLKNKTLVVAASGNSVTLLNSQDVAGAVTGDGTDQTLYTYTIPANTIQAGKRFRITWGFRNNNAAAPTVKITVGSTSLAALGFGAAAIDIQGTLVVTNKAGVQNAQNQMMIFYSGSSLTSEAGPVALSENFANAITVKVTVSLANPNTFTPRFWTMEVMQ